MRVFWRSVLVVLVAVLVWVSQSLVLAVVLGVVGRWVLLGVGPRHCLLRAWWVVLLVGLPFCPSGVSGGPAALLAEGCWVLVLSVFLCCVRLWCGRCSRFGVLCVFVELVLVAVVVVCVVRARVCVRCVGGAFGCLSSPVQAWVGGSVGVGGLCVVVSLPPWLWGLGVVPCHSWLGSVCGGVFPRRPLCVPFPPPSFSLPRCLARCSPGALSGSGWVGGGGVLDAGSGPFPWFFLFGGDDACTPRQGVALLYGASIFTRSVEMDLLRSQVLQPFPTPGSGTLWVTGESLRDRRVSCLPQWTVCPSCSPSLSPNPQYVRWGVLLVTPVGHPSRPVPARAADQRSRAYPTLLRVLRWGPYGHRGGASNA